MMSLCVLCLDALLMAHRYPFSGEIRSCCLTRGQEAVRGWREQFLTGRILQVVFM